MTDPFVDFQTSVDGYRHWSFTVHGDVATVVMNVDDEAGLRDDYELKLNSYDLGVDIELHDLAQRLRFEHPEVRAVVVTGVDKVFCAGANIQMLAGASHAHKVNFCKFTNETRNGIEQASAASGQVWIAAVQGTAAGGGYELALACDEILLIDDKSSAVSLPEVPLLAVLPGTGGLTRVVDKRLVRRDLADAFATRTEGVRGKTAVEWRLVDHIAPASGWDELIEQRSSARAAESDRPTEGPGIVLSPLQRTIGEESLQYGSLTVRLDRNVGAAEFDVQAPVGEQPGDGAGLVEAGADAWILGLARELDDAILHLRTNEPELGTWVFRSNSKGRSSAHGVASVVAAEHLFVSDPDHWAVRETRLFWERVLSRIDVTSRTIVAAIEPGSCFAGVVAELVLAADRSFMLEGTWEDLEEPPPAAIMRLTPSNIDRFPMANGLTRLQTRLWGRDDVFASVSSLIGADLVAADALGAELVTMTPDDLDWEDELRLMLEERNSFSPDALTGMEANNRFVGPETMTSKIFARLTAWQNWIFQRPNAVGPDGALASFGTGSRPTFDRKRV